MEIIVKSRDELKEILNRTDDHRAIIIKLGEGERNESNKREQSGAGCDIYKA